VPVDGDQAVPLSASESPEPQTAIQPLDVEEADVISSASVDALGIAIQHATLPTDEGSKVADEEAGSDQQAKHAVSSEDDSTLEKKPEAILPIQASDVLQRPPERRTRQASLDPTRPHNAVEAYLFSSINNSQEEQHKEGNLAQIIDGQWMETSAVSHLSIPSYSHRPSTSEESEYTAYEITCTTLPPNRPEGVPRDTSSEEPTVKHNCVHRRYNHFQHLDTILRLSYPLISIPALPEKKLTGRFTPDFLNARRRELERYLRRIIRQPLIRSHEAMLDFLTNDDEEVRLLAQILRIPSALLIFFLNCSCTSEPCIEDYFAQQPSTPTDSSTRSTMTETVSTYRTCSRNQAKKSTISHRI